ncbi:MAG: NYN domain-containing protein, partial [Firmicutes bacterium]|nr:NYN domain-containing protein [Bacillota bacterium]
KAEGDGQHLRSTADYDEKELESIMLREFGPIKRPRYTSPVYNRAEDNKTGRGVRKTYLIVDGYNMVFAWKELQETARTDIAAARDRLSDLLESFSALRGTEVLLVFDAYKVPGGLGSTGQTEGFRVVYTKEGESADAYIERMVREIGRDFNVKIVSSDGMIQLSALKSGTLRMSARELEAEVESMSAEIADFLDEQRRSNTFSNTPRQV